MIKILLDVRKITDKVRKEADNIGGTMDVVTDKAKSFFTNSLVIDKVIPALLGIITAGVSFKKMNENMKEANDNNKENKKRKKSKAKIFTEEEID